MFNDLIGKNKELGRFLFCERYTLPPVKNAMYIAEGQDLKRGAVVDVNGVLVGTNSLMPYAVLEFDCDTRSGGKEASVFIKGEFNFDKLTFASGLSKSDLDNIVYNGSGLGIVIKPYEYAEGFSPLMVPEGTSQTNPLMNAEETQRMIDASIHEVTLDPSEVALGNVHLLNEVTSFAADAKILVDSETNGPGAMPKDTLLDITTQESLLASEGFDFSFTGNGVWSSITKEWRKPMKANSKIIFSKINIEIGTAGYPFRFTGHKADGTDFTVGLGNVAGGELAENAVVSLTVPQDCEWLEFLFAAPSGSSNSVRVDFDTRTSVDFSLETTQYMTGCLSAPYASSTRNKHRFKPLQAGAYKLTLSQSFDSEILSSGSLLLGIYVVDNDGNSRTYYSQANDGEAVTLTHHIYFGKNDSYILIDAGLDAGTDISISLETSEGLVYTPDFRNFVEANLADFGDASYPNFELKSIGNFDGRVVNLPAFPIYVEQGCYIFSKDSSQYVFGCVIDGDGVQHALGDSSVKSVSISTTGMLFIAIQYGASHEIEYMVNSIMIVCPSADVMARVVEENAKYRNLNVSHVKKYHAVKSVNHRGYNHEAPENTLPAFRLSAEHGFDSIETDLQVTSDGHFVLFHDDTIDDKSDGTGTIASHTLAELKALDFGSWFSPEFAGTKIATLEEMLECCYNLGIAVALELKVSLTWAQIKEVLSIIKKYRMEGNISFCGFLYRNYIQLLLLERTATIALTQSEISDSTKTRLLQAKSPYRDVMISLNHQAAYTTDDINFFRDNGILIEWYAPSTEASVLAVADSANSVISDTINATALFKEHELAQ